MIYHDVKVATYCVQQSLKSECLFRRTGGPDRSGILLGIMHPLPYTLHAQPDCGNRFSQADRSGDLTEVLLMGRETWNFIVAMITVYLFKTLPKAHTLAWSHIRCAVLFKMRERWSGGVGGGGASIRFLVLGRQAMSEAYTSGIMGYLSPYIVKMWIESLKKSRPTIDLCTCPLPFMAMREGGKGHEYFFEQCLSPSPYERGQTFFGLHQS